MTGTKGFGPGGSGPKVVARVAARGGLDSTFAATASIPGLHEISDNGTVALANDDSLYLFDTPLSEISAVRHESRRRQRLHLGRGPGGISLANRLPHSELDHFSFDTQGRLLMSGIRRSETNGVHRAWIGRISADGVLDTAFGAAATSAATRLESVGDIVSYTDGHLIVLGQPTAGQVVVVVLAQDGTVTNAPARAATFATRATS